MGPQPRGATPSTSKITMSPTRQRPYKVRTTRDCLIVFMVQPVLPADETLSAALRGVWRWWYSGRRQAVELRSSIEPDFG
jgi:hypothetical protein